MDIPCRFSRSWFSATATTRRASSRRCRRWLVTIAPSRNELGGKGAEQQQPGRGRWKSGLRTWKPKTKKDGEIGRHRIHTRNPEDSSAVAALPALVDGRGDFV